jgi:hypothetical protein
MGAVLQQRVQDVCQPLAFFSRKLSPAQQKYSAYDRELLAIYQAVRYIRHMLVARNFAILTDHKPLTFAFDQKRERVHRDNLTIWISSPNSPLTSAIYRARIISTSTHSLGWRLSPRQSQTTRFAQPRPTTNCRYFW